MKYNGFAKKYLCRMLALFFVINFCTGIKCVAFPSNTILSYPDSGLVTADWIKSNLSKTGPRIIITSEQLKTIKTAIKNDEAIKAYYQYLYKNAESLLNIPVLERKLEGRRLLTVSRDAVKRIGDLAIVFAISNETRFLDRVNAEIIAVCNFSDWNPAHFLDVGEMAYAVSIGLDWTLNNLPAATQRLAKDALIEKALKPGLKEGDKTWVTGTNNWNQVCHGGLSIAAIAIADENPILAAQIISRALKNIPKALKMYAPDGAYPEGASYWGYGTSYSLLTITAFESAFNTDFGMSKSEGFLQSALFVKMLASPAGLYFNYFDSGAGGANSLEKQELFAWFAKRASNGAYFDKNQLIKTANTASTNGLGVSKLNGAALTWMVNANQTTSKEFPLNWKGDGVNPLIIFSSAKDDSSKFFLGAKGGAGSLSHGNMDAGSFVFDLNGVRWSVDLGMQDYTQLEAIIGVKGLWDTSQNSARWTLLSKNNFGHSTLTVNEKLHVVSGFAPLINFNGTSKNPTAAFNLTEVFKGQLIAAKRKFSKISNQKLRVEDDLQLSENTNSVTWAMMTQADATIIDGGILLKQNGKTLKVLMKQPAGAIIKIVTKNPPPLSYDMKVNNLKRLEFVMSSNLLNSAGTKIIVELVGEE